MVAFYVHRVGRIGGYLNDESINVDVYVMFTYHEQDRREAAEVQ